MMDHVATVDALFMCVRGDRHHNSARALMGLFRGKATTAASFRDRFNASAQAAGKSMNVLREIMRAMDSEWTDPWSR